MSLQGEFELPGGAPAGCPRGADRARCRPGRAAAGGTESAPARGGRTRRRAAAGPRRRRLGQDPRPHPPDRLPARHRRRPAGGDPRDHLHQQSRGGDARAGRAADRPLGAGDVGDDLPLVLRADAAGRRRAARLLEGLHDLRPGRLAADAETLPDAARGRPETVPAAGGPGEDLRRQEPADRLRLLQRNTPTANSRRSSPKPSRSTRSGCAKPTRWTSTTSSSAPSTRWSCSRTSASAGSAPSATSSSTSTRTPTTPSTGCCSCWPASTRT